MNKPVVRLKLLPRHDYIGVNNDDPIRFYYWPILGRLYRRRIEICLSECTGGERILEIGFGSGLTFMNLRESYSEIHGLDLTADTTAVQTAFRARGVPVNLQSGNVLKMPYPDEYFDTVLLISILEHLKPDVQAQAFAEIRRVLKRGGQVVYGVPVERPLMVWAFRLLGYDIRQHHFSTHRDVSDAASKTMRQVRLVPMLATPAFLGSVYEVGHFVKS
jgi:ubiquinone/menaquinone biosynthesis C-methylase UbiE